MRVERVSAVDRRKMINDDEIRDKAMLDVKKVCVDASERYQSSQIQVSDSFYFDQISTLQ